MEPRGITHTGQPARIKTKAKAESEFETEADMGVWSGIAHQGPGHEVCRYFCHAAGRFRQSGMERIGIGFDTIGFSKHG